MNRGPRFNGARYGWTGYTSNKDYATYKWENTVQAENVDFRNCVMYNVLHLCATKYPNIRAGFIHVPFACEQVVGKASTMASMPLETIAKSLEYCIEAVVTNKEEVKEAMGTTH